MSRTWSSQSLRAKCVRSSCNLVASSPGGSGRMFLSRHRSRSDLLIRSTMDWWLCFSTSPASRWVIMTSWTFLRDCWSSLTVSRSSPRERLGQFQRHHCTENNVKRGPDSLASSGASGASFQKRTTSQTILEAATTAPTILKGSMLSVPMSERKHRGPPVAYDKVQVPSDRDLEMVGHLVVTLNNTGPRIALCHVWG